MAWLELHQTLPTNKKTLRLKKLLKIKTPQAVGHLCMLWLWALDNAPDGNLSAFEADEIAEVAEWTGKNPESFIDALIKSGFVDSDKCLHDWSDYAGRLIDQRAIQREQSRVRKQRQRDKDKEKVSGHDDVTRDKRDKKDDVTPLPYPTVPNSTLPYLTNDLFVVGDGARAGAQETIEDFFDERGQRPERYFGFTDETQAQVEQIAREVYSHYSLNPPTKMDITNVFECTRASIPPEDPDDYEAWLIEFPKDKIDLLMYAFEAAAEAGSPGNWKYIRGVLGKLHGRGIKTLDQAETYDIDRIERSHSTT